jgi:hypothetical protein
MARTAKYPHRIEFRVTAQEYRLAEQLATQCDLTVSDLFRSLLKQAAFTDPARSKTLMALYRELGEIHQSLSQLKSCTQNHLTLPVSLLDETAALVNDIRRIIVQILSLNSLPKLL